MPPGKDPEWDRVVVMGQKGQIYEMPDARCQMPELRDFSSGAPRIREHFIRQNPSVGVAACKADPAGILKDAVAQQWEKLPTLTLKRSSMQERRGTWTGLQQAHQQQQKQRHLHSHWTPARGQ